MPSDPGDPDRPVPAGALATLREKVRGTVIVPGDDAYAQAHAVWNRDRQGRPAVIIAAGSAADAQHAVRFARAQSLTFTVRGGGYSPAGLSSCDGGVVLDLRGLRRVRVDPVRHRVVVDAGATWGDVDVATQRFGQVVPGTAMGGIGVAGSTLGGGFGNLRRAYGLACDNMVRADVVGADGERIATSGDEHPELLWGLRGGGGNFGVVTSLAFRLRPLPEPVLAGTLFFAAQHTRSLLRFYRDWTRHLRDDVTTGVVFSGAGPPQLGEVSGLVPPVPVVGVSVVCAGHPAQAQALIGPLRAAAPVVRDLINVLPYAVVQAMPDALYPHGLSAVMDSGYLDDIDDDVIDALCERHAQMPEGSCELHLQHMGGAVGRVARMSTAVPNRNARYFFTALARWDKPPDEDAHRDWLSHTSDRFQPMRVGGPNAGMRSAAMSSIDAYGAERYLRLAALKRRFDPENVFTVNQNVTPLV